jgi:predicted  nucleic acid-binding Zn-ribbon protein
VAAGEFEALQDNYRQATTELEQLREQHTLLENELQEMTQEFQEMTRESLELEKERGQLESLIDGLRDRCDALEGQLADEKMRFIGVKSPASGTADGPAVRENMSVMVLRQEFKRMMREARLEGVKLIRVSESMSPPFRRHTLETDRSTQTEQEERRKLEAELRKIRQANGPLGRQHSNGPFSPTRSNTGLSTPA